MRKTKPWRVFGLRLSATTVLLLYAGWGIFGGLPDLAMSMRRPGLAPVSLDAFLAVGSVALLFLSAVFTKRWAAWLSLALAAAMAARILVTGGDALLALALALPFALGAPFYWPVAGEKEWFAMGRRG